MYKPLTIRTLEVAGAQHALGAMRNPHLSHDRATPEGDLALAAKLIRAGDEHAKALRGIVVWFEVDMQVGFMLEFDTYRIGIDCLSTSSTMHLDLRASKGVELAKVKQANLPNVYYHRTMLASYQTLRRMYLQRRDHRHPDWQVFCDWVETLPHFEHLINPVKAA